MELAESVFIKSNRISWEDNSTRATLRNINLVVKPGEKVAVCGEVGSGKSTLLAAILGEVPHVNGIVSTPFNSIFFLIHGTRINTQQLLCAQLF